MRMLRNWRRPRKADLASELTADGITFAVTRKRIKNFYLRIDRGGGRVNLSAPIAASDDEIRSVVARRIDWIKRQQARIAAAPPAVHLRYATGEEHFLLGRPLRLEVIEWNRRGAKVEHRGNTLQLFIRRRSRFDERERAIRNWYRRELKLLLPPLVAKWEPEMNVHVAESKVKFMRTRWGTCNIRARRIWLNLELAKYPIECVEYVVVHEMVHLLERYHNARFRVLMDRYLPDWRERKRALGAGLGGNYNQEDGRDDEDDLCD